MSGMTAHEKCFNVFRQFPEGLTGYEFTDILDEPGDKASATSRLSQYAKEGLAVKQGRRSCSRTNRHGAIYVPTGKAFAERIPCSHGVKIKADEQIEAELQDLRAWKANAIKLFPELGTSPETLRARNVWAEALRSEGQIGKASIVDSGGLDDTEQMRVLLRVLAASS